MRKFILTLSAVAGLAFGNIAMANQEAPAKADSAKVETVAKADSAAATTDSAATVAAAAGDSATTAGGNTETAATEEEAAVAPAATEPTAHELIKKYIIDGGVEFMSIVLVCLIIGLTVAVERVITLNMASTNVRKLLDSIKDSVRKGEYTAAKEVCVNTRGPVAGVLAQGLIRAEEGTTEDVKDAVESYGSAEMLRLEKGMSWIGLFIQLAPMFGFMGTVIGMIMAFDGIAKTGESKMSQIGGDIKVALLTTVAGLVVAIILQFFQNYLNSKIDSLNEQMETANNQFMDMFVVGKRLRKEEKKVIKKAEKIMASTEENPSETV